VFRKTPQVRLLELVDAYKKRISEDLRQVMDKYTPFNVRLAAAFRQWTAAVNTAFPSDRTPEFQRQFGQATDKLTDNLAWALYALNNAGIPTMTGGDLDRLCQLQSQLPLDRDDLLFAAGLRSEPAVNRRPLQKLPRKPLL